MAKLIANRYASALFEAACDLEKTELIYDEVKALEEIFKENEDLLKVLNHPKIETREKKELIDRLFKGKIELELLNFLYILIDKNREQNLLEIIEAYEDFYYENQGILRVVAVTAIPLKEEKSQKLVETLEEKLGKKIQLSNEVDRSIIGGVKLRVEGKLVDGSIETKLEKMRQGITAAN